MVQYEQARLKWLKKKREDYHAYTRLCSPGVDLKEVESCHPVSLLNRAQQYWSRTCTQGAIDPDGYDALLAQVPRPAGAPVDGVFQASEIRDACKSMDLALTVGAPMLQSDCLRPSGRRLPLSGRVFWPPLKFRSAGAKHVWRSYLRPVQMSSDPSVSHPPCGG